MQNTIECKENLSDTLSEEQKEWYCRFQKLFGKDYESNIQFLKSCECFDQKGWKKNVKHILHKVLNRDCKAYMTAIDQIKENLQSKDITLVFKSLELTKVPTIIESLTHLKTLVLCDMEIHSLPPEMESLINLSAITITKCPIYEMPDWIGNFNNLAKLNFSRCRLSKISPMLSQCKKLIVLDLKYNLIKEFPEEIYTLPNLQRLDLEGNPIHLEWNNDSFPKLSNLNLSQTKTKIIPDNIAKRLMILNWNKCENIIIPSFGEYLRYINLAGSTLNRSPIEVLDLPFIEYINVPFSKDLKIDYKAIEERNITFILCVDCK